MIERTSVAPGRWALIWEVPRDEGPSIDGDGQWWSCVCLLCGHVAFTTTQSVARTQWVAHAEGAHPDLMRSRDIEEIRP